MLDDLLLLRLWAAPGPAHGEVRSKVAADLRPFLPETSPSWDGQITGFAAMVVRLAADGFLTVSGRQGARLGLTEEGRQRVRARFRISNDAATSSAVESRSAGWAWWRDHHALPMALGGQNAANAGELRALLLQRLYLPELPAQKTAGSLQRTVDLLLARRLKVSRVSLGAFREAALRQWVQQAALPETVIRPAGTVGDDAEVPRERLPEDLPRFAGVVNAAAERSPTGRFGEKKVFIAHVWRELLATGQAGAEEWDRFKKQLVQANTAGRIHLSRADLAGAHDSEDVRASEIAYLDEKFHFVRLD